MILQRLGNRGIGLGSLLDRAAQRDPNNVLILDRPLGTAPKLGLRITMADVAEHVATLAAQLQAAGVRPSERVVIYTEPGAHIPLLACACARIGAVAVLLSPQLDGDTVQALAVRADRPHLITDGRLLRERLPPEILFVTQEILLIDGEHPGGRTLASLATPEVSPAASSPDDPVLVTHTSGTTGLPKLAVHTSRTLQARYRPQWAGTLLIRGHETVALQVSPVHSRLFTAAAITLLRGWPLMILIDSDPHQIADLFAQYRPGVVEAHPNTLMRWEELADDPRSPLGRVRMFSSTFDALHPSTITRLLGASQRRRPRFAQLYGQSEVGPVVGRTYRRGVQAAEGRCVGRPFPGMTDVRVVSRDGKRPSPENPGYIEVRTDGRVLTYLGEDERYQRQLDGNWWRMGDLGHQTRWGRVYLTDREVDEIPGFGSTLAVEDALFARLPELAEVIIVSLPGKGAVPVVCTKGDVPLDHVAWSAATAQLPPMAAPVKCRLAELPQTATTKVRRLELARRLARRSEVGRSSQEGDRR